MGEEPYKFRKTNSQIEAVRKIVSSSATDIMLFGSSRSAKTFLCIYILIVRACKCKSNHIVVRNTFNSAKMSIFLGTLPEVLRLAFPDLRVSWDNTNYRCIFPNGSTIRIAGLDNKEKLERLLGTAYSTILVEECNTVPWQAVQKLKTRLAEKNDLKKLTLYTQNPTTTTSAYYQAFEQGINPIDGEAMTQEQRSTMLSIHMTVHGNLHNLDADYLKTLENLPEKERKRFLLGEYDSDNSGAAVYAFNRDDHVTEDSRRLQGTDWIGSDFNWSYNSDVIASQHANGIYVYDEVQIAGDTFQKADTLKRKGVTGGTIVCDSTGANRSTKGKSDTIILKEAGFNVVYKTNPAVKDKIANLNRCFTLGLIKINPRCKKLIRDLTQLVWDKNGDLDQKTDPSLSHLVDALAYLCWYLYPLQKQAQSRTIQL